MHLRTNTLHFTFLIEIAKLDISKANSMSFFKFNKTTKHRRFDYIPRFYDPEKEELDKIVDAYKESNDTNASKERIRSGLRHRYRGDANYKRSQERSANIRLISIIFILFLLAYLILQSDTIGKMMEAFLGGN